MLFSSETLSRILEVNFGYHRVQDVIFGEVLEISPIEAFRYSAITNSPYLLTEYGYSPFGKLITFNHRNYSINSGLFDFSKKEIDLLNAPVKLSSLYPSLFSGNKRLVFINTKTSNIESKIFSKIKNAGKEPKNYLITKVKKTGSDLEHFFEFIACKVFSNQGYYCENQIPWSYHGKPDFAAYKSTLFNVLSERRLISNGGFIIDLTMIPIIEKSGVTSHKNYEVVVGEVKSKSQKSQILDYLKTGLPDWVIEIMPDKKMSTEKVGLLRIKDDFEVEIIRPKTLSSIEKVKSADQEWFENYIKSLLLSNIPSESLIKIIKSHSPTRMAASKDLIDFIRNTSIDEIINLL
jgi:hypothetical protein